MKHKISIRHHGMWSAEQNAPQGKRQNCDNSKDLSMNSRSGLILVGLTTVLFTVACATTPPKTAAQTNADRVLAERVQDALASDPTYFFRHVDVDADDGRVSLSGYVWSDDAIRRAELVASRVDGVTSVVDQLTLEREGGRSSR